MTIALHFVIQNTFSGDLSSYLFDEAFHDLKISLISRIHSTFVCLSWLLFSKIVYTCNFPSLTPSG